MFTYENDLCIRKREQHELENLRNHVGGFRRLDGDIRKTRRQGCQFESRHRHSRDGHSRIRMGDRRRHGRRGADSSDAWQDMAFSRVVRNCHGALLAVLLQGIAAWRSIQSRTVGQTERPLDDHPFSGHPSRDTDMADHHGRSAHRRGNVRFASLVHAKLHHAFICPTFVHFLDFSHSIPVFHLSRIALSVSHIRLLFAPKRFCKKSGHVLD